MFRINIIRTRPALNRQVHHRCPYPVTAGPNRQLTTRSSGKIDRRLRRIESQFNRSRWQLNVVIGLAGVTTGMSLWAYSSIIIQAPIEEGNRTNIEGE
ncbi:hypothetical protein RUND412_007596 [Rhizina undulata]